MEQSFKQFLEPFLSKLDHFFNIPSPQFIMGAGGGERFDIQDRFVVELRRFATECNVHVSLVCHPRKHDAGWPLQLDSIYGGVRLTQEADNVVLLQRYKQNGETRNYIDLVKNRHSGNLGKVPLVFDPETRLYNLKDVENGKGDSSGSSGSSGSRIIKNVGYEML